MRDIEVIGAYEAKSRLSEYLRKVRAGGRFTITQRGEAVAELLPVGSHARADAERAAARMRAFMEKQPAGRPVDIRALIEEGRD